jgi:CheY-like chemotaxis protein
MQLQFESVIPDSIIFALISSTDIGSQEAGEETITVRTEDAQRPRALIVDDATDVTEMIAIFLRHAGYDAVMAFSAPAAMDAVREAKFDIIVSDIGMPGMNGYELARAVRSTPGYERIPMIAVTGFSLYDDKGRAIESGFNAHLPKPINPVALLELIDTLRA